MRSFALAGAAIALGAAAAFAQGLDLPVEAVGSPAPPPAPTPTPTTPPEEVPPIIFGEEIEGGGRSIVYVLDISGSMDLDRVAYIDLEGQQGLGTRLDRAKVELVR